MFPSGRWRGSWEQEGWGRRAMDPLTLRFAGGQVEGEGADCIGPFTFRGTYTGRGEVRLVKRYLGRHAVDYEGGPDGEGAVVGRWSIGGAWSGPFVLAPVIEPAGGPAITAIRARDGAPA